MLKCGVWTFFSRSPQLVRVPLKKKKKSLHHFPQKFTRGKKGQLGKKNWTNDTGVTKMPVSQPSGITWS